MAVTIKLPTQLRDLSSQLFDHPGLLDDQREQLLARRVFQPGHETT